MNVDLQDKLHLLRHFTGTFQDHLRLWDAQEVFHCEGENVEKALRSYLTALKGLPKKANKFYEIIGGLQIPEAVSLITWLGPGKREVPAHVIIYTPEWENDLDDNFAQAACNPTLCGVEWPEEADLVEDLNILQRGLDSSIKICPECLRLLIERYPKLPVKVPLEDFYKVTAGRNR